MVRFDGNILLKFFHFYLMFENLRAKEAISFLAIYAALQESPINIRKSLIKKAVHKQIVLKIGH